MLPDIIEKVPNKNRGTTPIKEVAEENYDTLTPKMATKRKLEKLQKKDEGSTNFKVNN